MHGRYLFGFHGRRIEQSHEATKTVLVQKNDKLRATCCGLRVQIKQQKAAFKKQQDSIHNALKAKYVRLKQAYKQSEQGLRDCQECLDALANAGAGGPGWAKKYFMFRPNI